MNFSIPSFGRKEPICQVHIQNTDRYTYEAATIYKIDAKDIDDSFEYYDLDEDWAFKDRIATDVDNSYMNQKYSNAYSNFNYYLLQNQTGNTLGIAEAIEYDDYVDLSFISTKPDTKYKYVGQTLLASIAQDVQTNGNKDLTVSTPTYEAYSFYTDVCGFNSDNFDELRMQNNQIPHFIQQTENRTQNEFINYMA